MGVIDQNCAVNITQLGNAIVPCDCGITHTQFVLCALFLFINLDQAELRAASAESCNDELIKAGCLRRRFAHRIRSSSG